MKSKLMRFIAEAAEARTFKKRVEAQHLIGDRLDQIEIEKREESADFDALNREAEELRRQLQELEEALLRMSGG